MEKAAPLIDIHRLIATIVPDLYCDPTARKKVKRLIRRRLRDGNVNSYLDAASVAEPVKGSAADLQDLETIDPFSKKILETPVEHRNLILDSMDEPAEAIYFNLLDAFRAPDGWRVEKLEDSVHAAPGSSVHGDFLNNRIQAQKQAMEILSQVQGLVYSIMQGIEELRGDAGASPNNGHQSGRTDRFLEIRRAQLRSQFEQLKIYARWLRPWLSVSGASEPAPTGDHVLANAFNTAQLRILLLATKEIDIREYVSEGRFPKWFLRRRSRKFYATVVVEFNIRAAPRRAAAGAHGYQGQTDIKLCGYALNEPELDRLKSEFDRQAMTRLLASAGNQIESVNTLIDSLREILDSRPAQTSIPTSSDTNPFSALAAAFTGWIKGAVRPDANDSSIEEIIRAAALIEARETVQSAINRIQVRSMSL